MTDFIIHAGLDHSSDFVLVGSDGVTGITIDPGDTGYMRITTVGVNPTCVFDALPMTIVDANNGTFNFSMAADQTSKLSQNIGFSEDNYNARVNYKGTAVFNIAAEGQPRVIDVSITVKEVPACPVIP